MPTIDSLFIVHRAKSGLTSQIEPGDVAYVSNGRAYNGVVGYIKPQPDDTVFRFPAIVLSALRQPTVQAPPFVARGSAGSGLVVLEPRAPMSIPQLAYYAALIGHEMRWRFHWYRQLTPDRVRRLVIPDDAPGDIGFPVRAVLPVARSASRPDWHVRLEPVELDALFDLKAGDYHNIGELPPGEIPIVSCGDRDNGIAGYVDVDEPTYRDRLTISFNGMNTLTTKYHPYVFAAKDDVAVCFPRKPLRLTTLLFVQVTLNRERWRYSYFRKCFLDKLRRFRVSLPVINGELDEDTITTVVEAAPYWDYISQWSPPSLSAV